MPAFREKCGQGGDGGVRTKCWTDAGRPNSGGSHARQENGRPRPRGSLAGVQPEPGRGALRRASERRPGVGPRPPPARRPGGPGGRRCATIVGGAVVTGGRGREVGGRLRPARLRAAVRAHARPDREPAAQGGVGRPKGGRVGPGFDLEREQVRARREVGEGDRPAPPLDHRFLGDIEEPL